ncbi:ribosomal protein S18 acetylase RimI-like enzyme [Pacificibacter maritimus]|uniref:Ribosomal protein S18 acetylase RimI-like enzyme n=1 Tax=Pacificibacter maritimus TaxID=762213 RepID=A0A3N4UST2_9RHOB|nr:GNAT family N-acetyltransferase [Pacificibacter maritimus]RPE71765.1 ribosomal protein S18 acetylase RimI-like enzyme [Pacificibacter maritimus]
MTNSLTIRPLTANDFDLWKPLWSDYLTFYKSSVPDEVTTASFARLSNPQCRERGAFVAEFNEEMIGFVHYITHAHNWHVEDVVYLQDLFVSPSQRGQGAARKLIEQVYAQADANGTPTVYWLTQDFNTTARKLYDSIGSLTPFIKYQRPL